MVGRAEASSSARNRGPHLVGRDRELAILGDSLSATLGGHGVLVLISGEAGIGKSALAHAVGRDAVTRGGGFASGHCYDLSETPPYGPWTEIVASLLAGRAAPAPPAGLLRPGRNGHGLGEMAFFAQVVDFLETLTRERPLVLLLEDLHWADIASLELLRFLVRALGRLPILLLATYRADELTNDHPLYSRLPLLVREGNAERLELRPLDIEAVRTLVWEWYGLHESGNARLAAHLQDRAEGNPFYVRELLRALEDTGTLYRLGTRWALGDLSDARVPTLLRQIIDRRLARLGEATLERLALAAIAGQEVPLTLWAQLAACGEEDLLPSVERAVRARLLIETRQGTAVRFSHALIREALYESLSSTRRRPIHRRIAELFLQKANPNADAIAYHFRQSGDPRAAAWLVRAGEQAQSRYAYVMAAERFEAALTLLEAAGTRAAERGRLYFRLARLKRYYDPRLALVSLDAAVRLAVETADHILAAHTQFNHGLLTCYCGELRQGLRELEAGVAALEALSPEDQDDVAVLDDAGPRAALVSWLAIAGHYTEARAAGEHLLAAGVPLATVADAHFGLGIAYAQLGLPEESRQAYAHARAAFRAIGHHFMVAITAIQELNWLVLPCAADCLDERQRLTSEAALAWTQATGAHVGSFARLPILSLEGSGVDIQRLALMLRAQSVSGRSLFASNLLGLLTRDLGDSNLAWTMVREALPAGPATAPGNIWFPNGLALQRLAALLALDAGDLTSARDWLLAHDRWLAWSGAVLGQADGQLAWAVYSRAAGDAAGAREHAAQALLLASAPRQPLMLLAAHRLLGELFLAAEDFSLAGTHLHQALALADRCAAPYERALALIVLAELRRATSAIPDAFAALAEARTICSALGVLPAVARIEAAGCPDAPTPVNIHARPNNLSLREREVLRLIAAGKTNREIAGELSISVRTIERHITNLYGKIGAHGKADATAYALRHALS